MDHQRHTMQQAPKYKGPSRTMPDTAEKKGNHKIGISAKRASPVSSQRNIDIVPQKTRECHMPPSPKILNIQSLIGGVEVERELDIKQQCCTDRHICITRKIKVKLKSVAQRGCPCFKKIEYRCRVKTGSSPLGKTVCDHHFLEQSKRKDKETGSDMPIIFDGIPFRSKLRHHLSVMHDRPCDKLRKESDKKGIVQKIVLFRLPPIGIHQISDLLKRKKGDRQRKRQMKQGNRCAKKEIKILNQKIRIFEIPQ